MQILKRLIFRNKRLYYFVEDANWSIKWDGHFITSNLPSRKITASCTLPQFNLKNSLLHFGSRNIYLPTAFRKIHSSNKVIFTWFHGTEQDEQYINSLEEGAERANFVHTSCQLSKNQLINWGASPKKIKVIPIGVDLNIFYPRSAKYIASKRRELGIPDNKIIIGSFQKDGNGWGEGNEPKYIKGPDIFCDVVTELSQKLPIHVLLTGPARGYVKNTLNTRGVSFTHAYLHDYFEIANYYPLLDLYIISSRAEGGPKALLESMASGVPVISTKVGMSPEVILHGENGFLAEVEDVEALTQYTLQLIENKSLREKLRENGLHTVQHYDYKIIAQRYYNELYKPLLS